ncbi:MAG: 3-dehydroquinate synthase [Eggerthellaceae bacterium]|nr:3-dehydroquinate synthase [Eggerthellaceae bacterium]
MPVAKVVVNFEDAPSYDVRIGPGLLETVGQRILSGIPDATAVLVLTDTNVGPLYAAAVRESCKAAGLRAVEIAVPAGESSKSVAVISEIWSAMAANGLDRDSVVVSLGGGVAGDIAGFAAATYMRGIHLVHAPTSLLAMVDSSVGGKTGIDLDAGKNLVGAFLQPEYVCADTSALATLPEREWRCGCAEVAKSSVICSDDFFFWLAEHAGRLAARDGDIAAEAITRSVVFKADVVAADRTERGGVRACLNYGHTLGHAIEKLAGYGTFSHGEAVAEGMRFAMRLAVALADASTDLVEAQDSLLDDLGLPPLDFAARPEDMLAAMRSDKKAHGGQVRFVLPSDVGKWELCAVSDDDLLEHLGAWSRSKG